MNDFFDMLGEGFKEASKSLQQGRDAAIRKSEKVLKISRLQAGVEDKRELKDEVMMKIAHHIYELYLENHISDETLLELCKEVKTLQWQIDEGWAEINHLKNS